MSSLDSMYSVNPIWLKSARSRLRLKHIASWGAITLTITAFVFMIIYMNMTEHSNVEVATAAKATIPGIVVVQSVILMMLGTGAVASGIAQERDDRVIDYQRMTPMSPTSKILGYLFGLPVREYFLFVLTLPFLLVAVVISKFSLMTLAHFYVVFFTSVLVYHMTGLVAGMLCSKPRFASILSMGFVMGLYFALPNLSHFGITYFEFLTIRPTFFGLLQQELPMGAAQASPALAQIDTFRDVPFFNRMMHPTAYTMLVQGFLLCVMFIVVHRKWRNQTNHSLSKAQALVVYAGVLTFVLASLWPMVTNEVIRHQVFDPFSNRPSLHEMQTLMIMLLVFFGISGTAFFLMILGVTPTRDTAVEGLRRARKHGQSRVGINSDAASSLPLALVMVALSAVAVLIPLSLAERSGHFFAEPPSVGSVAALIGLITAVGLFIQGMRERCGMRVFLVAVFMLWIVPWFAMMIIMSAKEEWVVGTYVGLPCPPISAWMVVGTLLESAVPLGGLEREAPAYFAPGQWEARHALVTASLVLYGSMAAVMQFELWRWKKRTRAMTAKQTRPIDENEGAVVVPV